MVCMNSEFQSGEGEKVFANTIKLLRQPLEADFEAV